MSSKAVQLFRAQGPGPAQAFALRHGLGASRRSWWPTAS